MKGTIKVCSYCGLDITDNPQSLSGTWCRHCWRFVPAKIALSPWGLTLCYGVLTVIFAIAMAIIKGGA